MLSPVPAGPEARRAGAPAGPAEPVGPALTTYVLTMSCADRAGILHALTAGIVESDGNVLENAQYSDVGTGTFCLRTVFEAPHEDVTHVERVIARHVARFDPAITVRSLRRRRRAILLVSSLDHCLIDLLYRWERGELAIDVDMVFSNHELCRSIVEAAGLEFQHRPVAAGSRAAVEAELLARVADHEVDFLVLARYMQVLSDEMCAALVGRIINIHHSFLPGFKGGKAYHQAYERGVKMIGATAHYATADLDEGPIIEQDVVRVTHAHTPEALVSIGRDVERRVLARAVQLHAEDRVILSGARTVVFA